MKNKVVISMLAITLAAGIGIGAATMSVTHTSTAAPANNAAAPQTTEITVEEIESRMRNLSVPVIGRIKEGRFLLDMRTFSEEGIEYLATQIRHVMERKHN